VAECEKLAPGGRTRPVAAVCEEVAAGGRTRPAAAAVFEEVAAGGSGPCRYQVCCPGYMALRQ
jgi:hypothetical protein